MIEDSIGGLPSPAAAVPLGLKADAKRSAEQVRQHLRRGVNFLCREVTDFPRASVAQHHSENLYSGVLHGVPSPVGAEVARGCQ